MRADKHLVAKANVTVVTQQIHGDALDEFGRPELYVDGWYIEVKPKLCGSVHCDRPHEGSITIGLRDSGHILLTVTDFDYDNDAMVRISHEELEELLRDLSEAHQTIHETSAKISETALPSQATPNQRR